MSFEIRKEFSDPYHVVAADLLQSTVEPGLKSQLREIAKKEVLADDIYYRTVLSEAAHRITCRRSGVDHGIDCEVIDRPHQGFWQRKKSPRLAE